MRVAYVIDYKRPDRERWSRPNIQSTLAHAADDLAASELARRLDLLNAPSVRDGYQIRLRMWPDPEDLRALLAFDPDVIEPAGVWTYDPSGN